MFWFGKVVISVVKLLVELRFWEFDWDNNTVVVFLVKLIF